jgi:asparagine synthase (glutamine-hydrolysing)
VCGIAGFVARPGASLPEERAARAIERIGHRGPDARGEYRDGPLWFGHLRLSILDLSESGRQPMATPDGRFVICYNGEVYNYADLVAELGLTNLRSRSDTEVVLRAVAERGPAVFRRLNGMFAIALYDRDRRRLWLVRDRLGIKPLYFTDSPAGFAFASEIKALPILTGVPQACDLSAMHEWLYYGNALGGRTLVAGIHQLPPGHALELDLAAGSWRTEAYWALPDQVGQAPALVNGNVVAETRRLLEAAVQRQLVSDVPVGVFLSGGVDSSAITAFAAKHYGGRLATYAAGFDDLDGVDERPKAARVAARFGTDHHEVHIGGGDVGDLVERMVRHHDLPFGDAANIPLYRIAEQISGTTKVVLQGDGGDELFGGYRRYVTLRRYRSLHFLARAARPIVERIPAVGPGPRLRRYVRAFAAPDLATTMARLLTVDEPETQPAAAFAPAVRAAIEEHDPFARYRALQGLVAGHDVVNQMLFVDSMIQLPDIFLEKVDRATMAASLEVRVPFLDHDLVDYVVRLPSAVKMPGGRKKALLKEVLTGIVPEEVLHGPKTGFSVPFAYWLRTSLRSFFFDHLDTFAATQPGVIEPAVVRSWYGELTDGQDSRGFLLWKLMNFVVWCNRSQVTVAV